MTRNYFLMLLMGALITSFGNWVSKVIPSPQDPPPAAVPAKVRFANHVVKNSPDGKPFVVKIFGDPKQIATDVKFCVEAFSEVEWLGIPSYDNSDVEIHNVMHVERERVAATADCFKIGRLDKDQTLTIRYPAKFKQSPTPSSPTLKLRNSGNGYSFDEILGARATLDRKDRKPKEIASDSTLAHSATFPVTGAQVLKQKPIDGRPDEVKQDREILAGSKLAPGFDIGVNSSNDRIDWLTQDVGQAAKMTFPSGQASWGSVVVTFGKPRELQFSGATSSVTSSLNSAALAIGSDASARLGGVVIKQNSDAQDTLDDTTIATNSAALAIGSGTNASIGGISVTESKFSGSVASNTAIIPSDPPRSGIYLSAYTTLGVEIRGDPTTTGEISTKDNSQPDDGTKALAMIENRARTLGNRVSGSDTQYFAVTDADLTGKKPEEIIQLLSPTNTLSFTISGQVTDTTGTPISGVTISMIGGRSATMTGADGSYVFTGLQDAGLNQFAPESGEAGNVRLAGFSAGGNTCTYTVSPASQFSVLDGAAVVTITASSDCAWAASDTSPGWVTITGTGSGNGHVSYVVAANSSSAPRSGSIFLSGSQPLAYSINFENTPVATAPAQTVVVTDSLASSSVLLTLSAISLPYGPQITTVPVSDASNQISRFSYDQNGNLTSLTDANGDISTYVYDTHNRLTTRTQQQWMSETYTYDAVGNRLKSTMDPNLAVDYSYDGLGNVVPKIGRTGTTTQYAYDAGGRLISAMVSGRTTEFSYDALNRLAPETKTQLIAPTVTAVSPTTGAAGQTTTVAITGQYSHFLQGTTLVSFGSDSPISVSSVTVVSAPTALTAFINEPRGSDASIYYFGARWLNPSSSRSITTDDERLTMVRPLRVTMLDNGGAHLTVTSEVDPAAEYQQRYQEERLEPDISPRPLRVRMLDSGGAHLTVTSEVDPAAEYQQPYQQEQIEPDVPPRPLRVRMLDSGGAHLITRLVVRYGFNRFLKIVSAGSSCLRVWVRARLQSHADHFAVHGGGPSHIELFDLTRRVFAALRKGGLEANAAQWQAPARHSFGQPLLTASCSSPRGAPNEFHGTYKKIASTRVARVATTASTRSAWA